MNAMDDEFTGKKKKSYVVCYWVNTNYYQVSL